MQRTLLLFVLILAWAGTALGQAVEKYTDSIRGFSLVPPAGTERLRETNPRRLVAWSMRDEKTGAIRWTLEVLRTEHTPREAGASAAEYAKAVAKELERTNNYAVESTEVGTLAGKPALTFRGVSGVAQKVWRRQTWVQLKPGGEALADKSIAPTEELVLDIFGLLEDKATMDAALTKAAESLTLFDPAAARREREEGLVRAAEVLQKFTGADLRAAVAAEPYCLVIQLAGKPIGCMKIAETIGTYDRLAGNKESTDARGLQVIRCGVLKLPEQPRRLIREELFASPDRSVEYWKRIIVEGTGPTAVRSVQAGLKQNLVLLLQNGVAGHPSDRQQRQLSGALALAYLPQALDGLVPRLLDRGKPAVYAFAVFNAAANDFDLRTVRVLAPEKIELGGKRVEAFHLTDQMAPDAPVADLWVDGAGLTLRMNASGGLVMERAEPAAMTALFAADLAEAEKLRDNETLAPPILEGRDSVKPLRPAPPAPPSPPRPPR